MNEIVLSRNFRRNDDKIVDDTEKDTTSPNVNYSISSYGADYDVEGLVKRLNREDIFIPKFQRNYVWSMKDASLFIESLLLGLPVPGVFMAREQESNKLLVIDGQQRLKTLQFYLNGFFNPREDEKTRRVFRLIDVQKKFEGKTYDMLDEVDKRKLNDSLIHSTIIKQELPENESTSIYHIFGRLNSSGRKLSPQEIRTAIYHGEFIRMIKQLNAYKNWRKLFGIENLRLKDQELILRYFALLYNRDKYSRPMEEFLNKYLSDNRNMSINEQMKFTNIFEYTINLLYEEIGMPVFRPTKNFNAAVFDAVMIGLSTRIESGSIEQRSGIEHIHKELMQNSRFIYLVSRATSNEENIAERINISVQEFSKLK